MKSKSAFWFVASVAAVSLAGCGKPSSSSHDADAKPKAQVAAAPGACSVLTEAIAKKYLGAAAVLKRDAHPNPRVSVCQYAGDHGAITVESGPWDMVDTKTGDAKPVAGLGDEAHSGPIGLFVRKGDHGLSIIVITASGEFWGAAADDMQARNQAAARKVAVDLAAND
jgi:hypothetical protein